MNEDIDSIVSGHGQIMVDRTAGIVAADIRNIIGHQEQLSNPEQVGSGLVGVVPLSETTIARKRAAGARAAETPRYLTGRLLNSIREYEFGDLTALVQPDAPYAEEQQLGLPSNGIKPLAARPFFGISDRALASAKTECEKIATKMVAALDKVTIQADMTVA